MKISVGCVADNNTKFLEQALRLIKSWRWFAGPYAESDFYICVVDHLEKSYQNSYEQYGGIVRIVSRFSNNHPPSNKLRFLELEEIQSADNVLLLDCDTVIVQNPEKLFTSHDFIAKIADAPTVPTDTFINLFKAFGIQMPLVSEHCTVNKEPTIPYFNAGVLSFSRAAIQSLVPEWINFNRALTQQINLLEKHQRLCEQASLSLALAKTKTSFITLGNEMNFPAHFDKQPLNSDFAQIDPVIIHYHWLVEENGLLKPSLYPKVNERIKIFNDKLLSERKKNKFKCLTKLSKILLKTPKF